MLEAGVNVDSCCHFNSEHHILALYSSVTRNLFWIPRRNMLHIKVNIGGDWRVCRDWWRSTYNNNAYGHLLFLSGSLSSVLQETVKSRSISQDKREEKVILPTPTTAVYFGLQDWLHSQAHNGFHHPPFHATAKKMPAFFIFFPKQWQWAIID